MKDDSHRIALFLDFDNIEMGVRTSLGQHFKISVILEALKEKGAIISKRAYGDWQRFPTFTREFSEHGVEMVQRVTNYSGDKNGADINIAVDAMELALTNEHIDVFAIASGDSDFLPLITRLKLHNKLVYVIGGLSFTSASIQKNCTEFIAYENLIRVPEAESGASQRRSRGLPVANAFPTVRRALDVLEERGVTATSGAVKSCMLQLDPTFDERTYGYSTFGTFLRALEKNGSIKLDANSSGGGYLVSLTSGSPSPTAPKPEKPEKPENAEAALEPLRKALGRIFESSGRRYVPASLFKKQVREIAPGFDERDYGFDRFSTLLKFAKDKGVLNMARGKNEAMVAPVARPEEPALSAEEPTVESEKLAARSEDVTIEPEKPSTMEEKITTEAEAPSIASLPQETVVREPQEIYFEHGTKSSSLPEEAVAEQRTDGKKVDEEQEKRVAGPAPRKRATRGPRRTTQHTRGKSRAKTAKQENLKD